MVLHFLIELFEKSWITLFPLNFSGNVSSISKVRISLFGKLFLLKSFPCICKVGKWITRNALFNVFWTWMELLNVNSTIFNVSGRGQLSNVARHASITTSRPKPQHTSDSTHHDPRNYVLFFCRFCYYFCLYCLIAIFPHIFSMLLRRMLRVE